MSSPNRSTSDIEDAFSSMNILNYTSVSPDYFPASSRSSSFNSSENSTDNMIPPVFLSFYNNPCLKDVQAFYAKEFPISLPDPITPPAILTLSLILPPSLLFNPRCFFIPEELLLPKKQIHSPYSSSTIFEGVTDCLLESDDEEISEEGLPGHRIRIRQTPNTACSLTPSPDYIPEPRVPIYPEYIPIWRNEHEYFWLLEQAYHLLLILPMASHRICSDVWIRGGTEEFEVDEDRVWCALTILWTGRWNGDGVSSGDEHC
ncbi:hypothetical protein Tco_0683722 [Tanacetum coccineum]